MSKGYRISYPPNVKNEGLEEIDLDKAKIMRFLYLSNIDHSGSPES